MKKGFWRRFILALVLVLSIFLPNVLPNDRAWAEESLLRIIFVDVGQADSTIIICDDEVLMIDGGNAADSQLVAKEDGRHVPVIVALHALRLAAFLHPFHLNVGVGGVFGPERFDGAPAAWQ